MTKNRFWVSSLVVLSASGLAWLAKAAPYSVSKQPRTYVPVTSVELFKDYRKWTLVNPEPIDMDFSVAVMCAPPPMIRRDSKGPKPKSKPDNPHQGTLQKPKFISVYVNDLGSKAMLKEYNPKFPVGSIIVKEKLPSRESKSPELLTAMIKRQAGYDPVNGDWEFVTLSGSASKITASGKLKNCAACHTPEKDHGYVFRTYLPVNLQWEIEGKRPVSGKKGG